MIVLFTGLDYIFNMKYETFMSQKDFNTTLYLLTHKY